VQMRNEVSYRQMQQFGKCNNLANATIWQMRNEVSLNNILTIVQMRNEVSYRQNKGNTIINEI